VKDTIIVDLDGTLADLTDRLPFIKEQNPPDWDSFFYSCDLDKPIQWVIDLISNLRDNSIYDIVIISGRSDKVKEKTMKWLVNNHIRFDELVMRKDGDHRPDTVVKLEMIQPFKERVAFIIDDRQSVVDMWRKEGFNVLQCNAWEESKGA